MLKLYIDKINNNNGEDMTLVYINNQWVMTATTPSSTPKGSSAGSEDKDPVLQNLLNSLYYTESPNGFNFSNPPTQAELETFAQGINNLSAYFAQNGIPDPVANPNAYGIYNAINSIPAGMTESPADLCADLMGTDPTKSGAALAALQTPTGMYFINTTFGSEAMNNWFHGPNEDHAGSQFNQNNNTIKTDISDLQADLVKYNQDLAAGKSVKIDLMQIAQDVANFNTDSTPASGKQEDGYLQTLTEFLGSASDPNSILSLAAAVNNDPSAANLQALQTALQNDNENGKTTGDFTGVLNFAMWGEF